MAHIEPRNHGVALGLILVAAGLASCSNDALDSGNANQLSDAGSANQVPDGGNAGVTVSGQKLSCTAPACCQPIDIEAQKIVVAETETGISISAILNLPAGVPHRWGASVDVSLSWGGSITCTIEPGNHTGNYAVLYCPEVPLSGAPACDSQVTLGLRPSTSTYSGTDGAQALCTGKLGGTAQFTVPLTCPTCPAHLANFSPCSSPGNSCDYAPPCRCTVNDVSGDWRWSCAVP